MSGYVLAMGAAPVHLGALTAWLRTRAKWLLLDVMPDASGSHDVVLRAGGPYASPDMAYLAARHFREDAWFTIRTLTSFPALQNG